MTLYKKEELIKIIEESKTYYEVLVKSGKNSSSAGYKSLKRYIKKWELDISHFLSHSDVMKLNFRNGKLNKIENENLFVKDSLISRNAVKNRIIKEGIIAHSCFKCGNNGEWLGEKITLIMDHINGINNDNRITNLRFVCPNCNSTLKTHCVGSKGLKQKVVKIDGRTLIKVKMDNRKVKDRPPIETIKEDIRILGYSGTGRKYGVSDNAIRKWIK